MDIYEAAGLLGGVTAVAMVVHAAGFILGWWPHTYVTWWVSIVLLIFVSAVAVLS